MPRPTPTYPQAGITNRPPDHALLAALTLTTTSPEATRTAVEALRVVIQAELRSDLDHTTPASSKDQPSAETGELGFTDDYDRYHLTVTVGFGAGFYEKLGIPPEQRPQDLIPMPWDKLSDQPDKSDNGDILLQVCTNSVYLAEHVLRRVEEELSGRMAVAWTVAGAQRHNSRSGRVNRQEGRALIGFLDGTANLNPRRSPDDARLVFVDPEDMDYPPQVPTIPPGQANPYGGSQPPGFPPDLRQPPTSEPSWAKNGTYMVVRASTVNTADWDRRTLGEQERTIGRWKVSGSPLDAADDPSKAPVEDPNFSADPDGTVTPLASHVRKTNPRAPEDADRRIFRRGYPLIQATLDGQQRGLLFVCFGRTITTQFEFITRAWTANPNFPRPNSGVDMLRAFEHVLCGGYFFAPPLRRAREPWSWVVPDSDMREEAQAA